MACGGPCDIGLQPGEMRHELEVQQNTPVADLAGGREDVWATIQTLRVKAEDKTGRESFFKQKENTEKTYIFTTWYIPGIEPDLGILRFIFKGKVYDFTRIENVNEMNRVMKLTAKLNRDQVA